MNYVIISFSKISGKLTSSFRYQYSPKVETSHLDGGKFKVYSDLRQDLTIISLKVTKQPVS